VFHLLDAINKAAEAWGVDCKRYEIRKSTELYWTLSDNFKTKLSFVGEISEIWIFDKWWSYNFKVCILVIIEL